MPPAVCCLCDVSPRLLIADALLNRHQLAGWPLPIVLAVTSSSQRTSSGRTLHEIVWSAARKPRLRAAVTSAAAIQAERLHFVTSRLL